ncbi:DUF47 domain-containing protein [Alicyclobacillus sp. SO9]|uniref:DUF47 domain-containing protein n=1 Tax=Alicyclobacillus sp. SO9 TaxID=2665646 RepID=UPI0018E817C3|nr:DUF47 family protein [Alicyclobacillus sp. SO9]QQE78628.1 DUF47 domain-containing protein [Alicyclobacillus sp. SO9]
MPKRSHRLFEYLVQISENIESAAAAFTDGLNHLSDPEALTAKMRNLERTGDELTRNLMSLLDATYITPLDREDYLTLAVRLDDIVDGLEAVTVRFDVYNVKDATPVMYEFAENINNSVNEITQSIANLQTQNLVELRAHTAQLNQLEKVGDQLLFESLRELFRDEHDPLTVIKLKEIYEILEGVTDRCEDVADLLDSIIVKNA